MQNTAVQMTNTRSMRENSSVINSSKSAKDRSTVSAECADPFLQIIMSLISQSQVSADVQPQGAFDAISGNSQLVSLLQNTQSSQNIQNPQQTLMSLFSFTDSQNLQQYLGSNQAISADQLLQLSQLFAENLSTAQSDATGTNLITQLMNLSKTQGTDGLANLLSADDLTGLSMNKNASLSAVADTADMLSTEKSYSNAITKVKEMLASTGTNSDDSGDDIDVDVLQSELIKSKVTTPFELSFKTTEKTSDSNLLNQVSTSIKQNFSLGKNEFTIKLKPEALGEITIKIVEEAGKSTLSITTASAQTAKLINNDLAALKQAIAPLNVHVNEAVTHTNESQQGSMQQFDMAGQQFAGQQFAGQQNFTRFVNATYGNSDGDYYVSAPEEVQSISASRAVSDRLDAYI